MPLVVGERNGDLSIRNSFFFSCVKNPSSFFCCRQGNLLNMHAFCTINNLLKDLTLSKLSDAARKWGRRDYSFFPAANRMVGLICILITQSRKCWLCSNIPPEVTSISQLTPEMFIEVVVRGLWLITNGDAKVKIFSLFNRWINVFTNNLNSFPLYCRKI